MDEDTSVPSASPYALRGSPLCVSTAEDDEWLILWPLADTIALSRGELLIPPGEGP
jgi:hypothetical protein